MEFRQLIGRVGECSEVRRCIEESKGKSSRCHEQQIHRSLMTNTKGTHEKNEYQGHTSHGRRSMTISHLPQRRQLSRVLGNRVVSLISEFLERHSKAKHTRAPTYSRVLPRIKGVVQVHSIQVVTDSEIINASKRSAQCSSVLI